MDTMQCMKLAGLYNIFQIAEDNNHTCIDMSSRPTADDNACTRAVKPNDADYCYEDNWRSAYDTRKKLWKIQLQSTRHDVQTRDVSVSSIVAGVQSGVSTVIDQPHFIHTQRTNAPYSHITEGNQPSIY